MNIIAFNINDKKIYVNMTILIESDPPKKSLAVNIE
jgi:hypothetical protein